MKSVQRLALCFLMPVLIVCTAAYAGDSYWVSPEGQAAWDNARSATPLSAGACCSLKTACVSAQAGDTVYLRAGTYSVTASYAVAMPIANSGEAGPPVRWLTFKNAPGETPQMEGTAGTRMWGLLLEGNSYVCVDGIQFECFSDSGMIDNGSHHIEVKNCGFRNGGGFCMAESVKSDQQFPPPAKVDTVYTGYVSHIWVHHNVFSKLAPGGLAKDGTTYREGGDAVRVGYPKGTGHGKPGESEGKNHHITIEDNLIEYAGHACMDHYGTEMVVNNNVIHNEPWYTAQLGPKPPNFPPTFYTNAAYRGLYSHRNYQSSDDFHRDSTRTLIEGNRLGHAGVNPNNDGGDNMDLASPKNIFRYNSMYNAMNKGLMFKYSAQGNGRYNRKLWIG